MNASGQPSTVGDAIRRANSHLQAGRLGEAELIYRQVLVVNPDHFDALHFLGVIAGQTGKHAQAAALIRRAIQQKPSSHAAHSNLGEVLVKLGRMDEAIAAFRQAIALKPDYFHAHYNLGCTLLQQEQIDEAIQALEKARSLQNQTKRSGNISRDQDHGHLPTEPDQRGIVLYCDGCFRPIATNNWWHCLDCDENLCTDCHSQSDITTTHHTATHTTAEYCRPPALTVQETKEAILECSADLRLKLARQNGVCTFFDYMLIDCLDPTLAEADQISIRPAFLLDYLARRKAGRFVDFFERQATFGTDIPHHIHGMSQGVSECLQWKGQILFKSAFDLAIYQMLFAELRPATVIEIGSGNGGSAIWFADLMRCLEIKGHIYSLDLHKPRVNDPQVTFLVGDCANIESILHPDTLASWPTPWLVIEDAHVNVATVLDFFDRFLRSGDYLVVEDSKKKENVIGKFLLGRRHKYRVDTRYTDLLGKNATSCFDSILRHM